MAHVNVKALAALASMLVGDDVSVKIVTGGDAYGMATHDRTQPVICLRADLADDPELLRLTFYHEVAHHIHGHIPALGARPETVGGQLGELLGLMVRRQVDRELASVGAIVDVETQADDGALALAPVVERFLLSAYNKTFFDIAII